MSDRFENADKIVEILNEKTMNGKSWGGEYDIIDLTGSNTCRVSVQRIKNRVPNLSEPPKIVFNRSTGQWRIILVREDEE